MARSYEPPAHGAAPRLEAVVQSKKLSPTSTVTLVFRGGPPVIDKFDGRDFIVPPLPPGVPLHEWRAQHQPASRWQVEYQVAAHLQKRAIVPGSRNPHTGRILSQLGIEEIDRPDRLEPFSVEQLKQFGLAREGLDRSQAELPSMREVTVINTTDAVSASLAAGQDIDDVLERAPGEEITAPPEDHQGLRDVEADTAAYEASGGQASRTRAARGGRR